MQISTKNPILYLMDRQLKSAWSPAEANSQQTNSPVQLRLENAPAKLKKPSDHN